MICQFVHSLYVSEVVCLFVYLDSFICWKKINYDPCNDNLELILFYKCVFRVSSPIISLLTYLQSAVNINSESCSSSLPNNIL